MSIVGNPATQALAERVARASAPPAKYDLGSPQWWRDLLFAEIVARRPRVALYGDYYAGRHRLAFATEKFRDAFGSLFSAFADNWCDLIVDAAVERLGIEGFRFGGTDKPHSSDAEQVWQDNGLDAEADLAHSAAVALGEAYLLVAPSPGDSSPVVQVEHPACAIVAVDPARPRRRLAGLRVWVNMPEGTETVVLYLPDEVYWWVRPLSGVTSTGWAIVADPPTPGTATGFAWEAVPDQTGRNPLGVVPLVPLSNNPQLLDRRGRSDIARVIPIQDAINKLVTDMLVASEFCAFPQRYAIGVEAPIGADGRPPPTFLAAVDRVWTVEAPDVRFGEFTASDLSNYVRGIEALVQHVAAQTRTPPHYLLGSSGNFPSGESLKATETGLVAKVRRKQLWFGEAWEEAMRLAFRIMGRTTLAEAQDAETIWRDPESRSEAERVDALVKMATLGVPHQALWARWGATPQEVEQWQALRDTAILDAPVTIRATEQIVPPGAPATGAGAPAAVPAPPGAPPAAVPAARGATPQP